jgi:hypothetical protein
MLLPSSQNLRGVGGFSVLVVSTVRKKGHIEMGAILMNREKNFSGIDVTNYHGD